jgi:hypothetical protein
VVATRWVLAGRAGLPDHLVATSVCDAVALHSDQLGALRLMAVVHSLSDCISALGEDIGWRGFLGR